MEFKQEDIESWVGEPIQSFTSGQGTNKGDNVASDILRIQVKTVSGKEHTLVYKQFPAGIESQGAFAVSLKIFWRENQFYRTIAPAIESTAQGRLARLNSTETLALPIPKFYAGFNNDKDDFVCLGDLRPEGFKMPDKKIGLDLAQMTLCMVKIAEFHALSYFYLRQAGEGIFLDELNKPYLAKQWLIPFEEVYEGPDSPAVKAGIEFATLLMSEIYKNAAECIRTKGLGPDREKLASRMAGEGDVNFNQTYQITAKTTLGTDVKYFPLIIHGDFWLNNVLFSYDEQGEPKDMKIVDFQFTRRGNIYEDLNYFVYTSTTAEFRRKNLINVLNAYYNSFEGTLGKLGSPLPTGFSRGSFMDGFYENILPAYIFLAFALPLQLGSDGEDDDPAAELMDRLKSKMAESPLTLLRMEEATREMVEIGIL